MYKTELKAIETVRKAFLTKQIKLCSKNILASPPPPPPQATVNLTPNETRT